MASEEVKLLGSWASAFVIRARIALNIKGIEYKFIEEKFGSESDLLLRSNPIYKKIPVFFHGDNRPICDSLIIVQYIDEVWTDGPAILPPDPYDRAVAQFWATYIDDKWVPSARAILMANKDEARNAASEVAKQCLLLLENVFIKCSEGRKFFGGDIIGYLDIALGCFVVWVKVIEKMGNVSLIDESDTPNLFRWAQHFSADAAVKDLLPEIERLQEYAKVLVATRKN